MNDKRRKFISRGYDLLSEGKSLVDIALEEEQDCYDNLPEGIQCSERGDQMQENIDALQECSDNADAALCAIEGLL